MTSTDTMLYRRNATLADLVDLLKRQQVTKLDAVVPAAAIDCVAGALHIAGLGGEPVLTADGVTTPPGVFHPTAVCDTGLADKLFRTTEDSSESLLETVGSARLTPSSDRC